MLLHIIQAVEFYFLDQTKAKKIDKTDERMGEA
jgi:hypothetical protein